MTDGTRPEGSDPGSREAARPDAVPSVWSRYTDLIVDHGEGSWLVDVRGRRYLDFSSGIGVVSTGHAHPEVAEAIAAQARKLIHGQQNIVYHTPGVRLHERLATSLPGGPWRAFLANSGTEAIENAVKLARAATGRPAIVTFQGGFHGRTYQAMAMTTSRHVVRGAFDPLPAATYQVPFPYCYRAPTGSHAPEHCSCDWEGAIEAFFVQVAAPSTVAAFVVEPVLGEGGYVVPPSEFLTRLRDIATRHGILLVVDEIQTGVARTGHMWCVERSGILPDILVFAKGIASGMPLSGLISRAHLLDGMVPGSLGGTYGGNVVACAAAMATLDVVEREGLAENARMRGDQLLAALREQLSDIGIVGDIRGLGLMVGIEFIHSASAQPGRPNPEAAQAVLAGALADGLIALSAGSWGHVVRLCPPLVTTSAEVDEAVRILGSVVRRVAA